MDSFTFSCTCNSETFGDKWLCSIYCFKSPFSSLHIFVPFFSLFHLFFYILLHWFIAVLLFSPIYIWLLPHFPLHLCLVVLLFQSCGRALSCSRDVRNVYLRCVRFTTSLTVYMLMERITRLSDGFSCSYTLPFQWQRTEHLNERLSALFPLDSSPALHGKNPP